jgi:hypothetical protein
VEYNRARNGEQKGTLPLPQFTEAARISLI